MRVVLSNLTAIRQKTGIGHYVTELVGSLRADNSQIIVYLPFPVPGWKRLPRRCLSIGEVSKPASSSLSAHLRDHPDKGPVPNRRAKALAHGWAAWHFRTFWSGRAFDLYHEPNYIPFPCDKLTIATIHDLSVMLHPEWHPADRVAHYERNFEPGLKRCSHLLAVSEFTRGELLQGILVSPRRR